jgi:AraC-like DNA-binding protein
MLQSDGVESAPVLDFEAWRALLRSNCGGRGDNAFAGWMRPLSAGGLCSGARCFRAGKPLSEIAYPSGFRDYVHFARRFRNRFGCPPGAHAGYDQDAHD